MFTSLRRLSMLLVLGGAMPAFGQAPGSPARAPGPPTPEQIARMRRIGLVRAGIGTSGLRRFLSETSSLGELRNRTASYRIIAQVEGARASALEGRISALEGALQDPTLPAPEQARLRALIDDARADLTTVPRYLARYHTSTAQAGTLAELAFAGARPTFLLVKGRFAWRTDPDGYLDVRTARLDVAPVVFPGSAWFLSAGLTASRTDVDVLAFDGTSGAGSVGVRLDAGAVIGGDWAVGLHAEHAWASNETTVLRPLPEPLRVRSETSTRTLSAKAELMGRVGSDAIGWLPGFLEVSPRAGAYVARSRFDPATNSLGETTTGVFGDSDVLALIAVGLALDFDWEGRLVPTVYVGVDHELHSAMTDVLADRTGVVIAPGLAYLFGRSKRVGLTYALGRSTGGRRRSGEVDLVGVIDF